MCKNIQHVSMRAGAQWSSMVGSKYYLIALDCLRYELQYSCRIYIVKIVNSISVLEKKPPNIFIIFRKNVLKALIVRQNKLHSCRPVQKIK